jgi:signal transduction histidine kinase
MSLRLRLAAIFAFGSAVLIAVAGLALLWQLHTSLAAALDSELRQRAAALAAQLASGPLPPGSPAGPDQTGSHTGQFPAAEQVAQVLTPAGAVVYSSGIEGTGPLLSPAQLRQVAGRPLTFTAVIEGERLRLLASEVHRRSRPAITVAGVPTDVADAAQARARLALLIGGPPVVLAAGLGGWLLTDAALRPVGRMRRRLEEITEYDTNARLPVPATGDEIAALAFTMNGLLDRLARALARQRAFTADAGHELRTPLTALKAELELAARPGKSREALADAIQAAAGDADRLIRLAEDLLLLARADEGTSFLAPARIDLSSELHAAARRFASTAAARGVAISVQAAGQLDVVADRGRVRQALDNLIDNAVRHAPREARWRSPAAARWPRAAMAGGGRWSRSRCAITGLASHASSSRAPSNVSSAPIPPGGGPMAAPGWGWPSWPPSRAPTTGRWPRATTRPEERGSGSNFPLIRGHDQRPSALYQPSHGAQTVIS